MLSGIQAIQSPMVVNQQQNRRQLLRDAIAALPLTTHKTEHQRVVESSKKQLYLENPEGFLTDECILEASKPYAHKAVYRRDVYAILWQESPERLSQQQLHWLIREDEVLQHFQESLSQSQRDRFLQASFKSSRRVALEQLWQACLKRLDLNYDASLDEQQRYAVFLESFQHKSNALAQPFNNVSVQFFAEHLLQREGQHRLDILLDDFAWQKTLGDILDSLTGENITEVYLPQLMSHLQQWPGAQQAPELDSFYRFFRHSATAEQHDFLASLPTDPLEAIMTLFADMALPQERWGRYLERLWRTWPSCTGYFIQRLNTEKISDNEATEAVIDNKINYLAVCFFLEYMAAQELCHSIWLREPGMDALYQYFHASPYELIIRCALYNEPTQDALPEALLIEAQAHLKQQQYNDDHDAEDEALAHKIFAWKQYCASGNPEAYSVTEHAWLLFILAQHLGLAAHVIEKLDHSQLDDIFDCIGRYRDYSVSPADTNRKG